MAKPKESIPALTPLNFKEGKLKSNSLDKSMDAGDSVDKYDPSVFCRTCANLDPCLVPIFKDEGLDYNLHRKIEKYLPIQVSEKDDLPVHICYHCASTLIAWDTLVEGCVEAEKKLTALKKSSKTKDSDEVEDGGELIIAEIDSDDEPLIAKKLAPERVDVGEKRDILQEKNDFQDLLEPIDMESERLMEEPDLSFSNYQHQFSMYRLLYFEIFSLRIESAFCCNICAVLDEVKMKFLKSLTRLNNENNDKENDKQTDKRNKEEVLVEERPVERQKDRVRRRSGPDGELVCENCGKVCLTRLSWRNHMRIHRIKEFPCRQCGKIFTCRFNLVRHVQGVHERLKKHVCKTCGKRYRSRSEMNDHRTVHKKKVEKIVCEDCGRMYLTKASFYSHRKLHREVKESGPKKVFSCDECHKTFTTKKSKIDHTLIHTGEKPLSCDVCKKNFRTRKGLEQHMPIHTGVKPYDCKHCGKAFARKDHLRIHIRCHTGEKPYTCEYCGKGCAQLTDIKKHLKTHTRVR